MDSLDNEFSTSEVLHSSVRGQIKQVTEPNFFTVSMRSNGNLETNGNGNATGFRQLC